MVKTISLRVCLAEDVFMCLFRLIAVTSLLSLVSVISFGQDAKTYKPKDQAALNNLVDRWGKYWNNHDMDSMGSLLHDDVDFVTVAGAWLKGKKEAVSGHKERHKVIFKTSIWRTDKVTIKYVSDDLAIIHINWGINGDVDPDGTPRRPRNGIFTWVVIKQKQQWLLLAVHNVNIRETGLFTK
jgi:uncharacterized protein (TIGR02246 family)